MDLTENGTRRTNGDEQECSDTLWPMEKIFNAYFSIFIIH